MTGLQPCGKERVMRACELLALVEQTLILLERDDDLELAAGAKWTVQHVRRLLVPLLEERAVVED
jgi:hypothetical protein